MTIDPDRGRVRPPNLDDRTWADLVAEMRALIPHYAPAWTDQNPSDLGITLIELFAWLGESVIYRLNQVPEKNYLAFVNLLGITRAPATPARTHLTFTSGPASVVVPAGTQAQTVPAEGEEPVVFETDDPVRVLPVALQHAVLVTTPAAGASSYADATGPVVGPPAGTFAVTVPAGRTVQLCLGFDAEAPEELRLGIRLHRPLPDADTVKVRWTYSRGTALPTAWPDVPGPADGSGGLRRDGTVRLAPPADWSAQRPTAVPGGPPPQPADPPLWTGLAAASPADAVSAACHWIGLRIENGSAAAAGVRLARVLFNAAPARTALTLRADEVVGTSDGSPHQVFALAHRPLYRRPDADDPFADLVVQVGVGTPPVFETWRPVDEPPPGAAPVFRVDPVTGELRFGDHSSDRPQGNGSVPPRGAVIRARYRHVAAGAAGNVAAGQVTVLSTGPSGEIPTGVTGVVNLGAAVEGADEEPVETTLRRAPDQLRARDRAVTADDYEFLVREASPEVSICRCLPPRLRRATGAGGATPPWQFGAINRSPGIVNVVVVPDQGPDVPRPEPTPDLLREVKGYLDQRRDLAAGLEVHGPRYIPVIVEAALVVWSQAKSAGIDEATLKAQTLARIATFLHPTRGGPGGAGWQVGQPVFGSDLFRAIMPPDDVGYVSELKVGAGAPLYGTERPFDTPDRGASVRLADYELVCAADPGAHVVRVAEASN